MGNTAETKNGRILACDGIDKTGIEILREHFDVDEKNKLSESELIQMLSSGEYVALLVRSATKVNRNVIEKSVGLKAIGRAGIGVDNIDVKSATERGIVVMNTLGAANTTAEHTVALIFSVARRIAQSHLSVKQGKWEKSKFIGKELAGKTIGIIGLGNIGKKVAEITKSIGMNVIFFDPYVEDQRFKRVSFEELLQNSDIITIHVPLNEKTKNMIGDEEFKKMKDGVIIINCARGGIIDENALAKYIEQGKVWGAGIDTFAEEPPPQSNPLLQLENVTLTPHIGASTVEGQKNASIEIAKKILKFLKYGVIEDAVNFVPVPEDKKAVLDLADKLGSFLVQAYQYPIRQVKIAASMENIPYAKYGGLFGISKFIVGEDFVSPLNAESTLKSRGVDISEKVLGSDELPNKISVEIKTSDGIFSISGMVIGKTSRIIEINGLPLEAPTEGNFIFSQNEDKPGVVGKIGTFLGENGINIASIHLGRDKPGGKAISLINVDEIPPQRVLEGLRKIPHVLRVVFVKL